MARAYDGLDDDELDAEPETPWKMLLPMIINALMSIGVYLTTVRLIPKLRDKFIKANLFGIDMSKTTQDKV